MSNIAEFGMGFLSEPEVTKKRPGRPKKQIFKKTIPQEGIVSSPTNIELESSQPELVNIIEFVYSNPMVIKKLIGTFKSFLTDTLRFKFEKTKIKIYALSHTEENKGLVVIYGDRVNRYYCEQEFEIGVPTNKLSEIFAKCTKENGSITISSTREDKYQYLFITLTYDEMDEILIDRIDVDAIEHYDWDIEDELAKEYSYALHFDIPFKLFKKKLSDFTHNCEILRIEKTGHEDLHFNYNHKDKRGNHNSYYRNPGKLNLISRLEEDDIFSTSVCLEHIKSISSVHISDKIHIAVDYSNDMISTIFLDQKEVNECKKKYTILGTEIGTFKILTKILRAQLDE